MGELLFHFKGKYASGTMLASSFRLDDIKQMLVNYGEDVIYIKDETKSIVNIILPSTLSEEKDKEISILLRDYFHEYRRKLGTCLDFPKYIKYEDWEG